MKNYEVRRLEIMERKLNKPQPREMGAIAVIDILRCVAWFEYVRDYLQTNVSNKLETPYAIGKVIKPDTYRGASSDFSNNNLWPKYAAGLHCPSQATLAAAEEKAPGATAIFDAPVWKILNVANPVGNQIDESLRTLRVGVQETLYDKKLLRFGMYRRRKVGQAMLSNLECQACGLDSLAAAVHLLKEACREGDSEQRFRIGESLHRILLMTCMSAPVVSYRMPLIAYFSLFVFPLAASDSLVIDVPIDEFYETTHLLNIYMLILEDEDVICGENGGPTRERRRILNGNLGMDMQFGFMPRLKVVPGCRDSCAAGEVARRNIGKDWGLSVLRQYRFVSFPPEEILLGMKAAYDKAVSASTARLG